MKTRDIRSRFIDFFAANGLIVESDRKPLVFLFSRLWERLEVTDRLNDPVYSRRRTLNTAAYSRQQRQPQKKADDDQNLLRRTPPIGQ